MVKTGVAFPDYISTEKLKRRGDNFGKNYSIRSYLLPLILTAAVCLIFARLFFLQIIKGSDYRSLSDNNRTKTIAIHAPRGIIFDRDGVPLVFNVPGFRQTINDKTKPIEESEALRLLSEGKTNLEIDSLRNYPYKDAFSHVLGYIGQISKEELKLKEFENYKGGELIGKIGIEKKYESMLAGIDGKELVEVDSMGRTIRKLGQTAPLPGQNITLTLDIGLQKAAFEAVKDVKKGAIIVSNLKGEILALLSRPSFDPNLFTMGERYSVEKNSPYVSILQILLDSENQPLLNRAIGGTYPPGSTFKLITAAAGLENKVIDENFVVQDTGILRVGAFSFGNWYFIQYGKLEGKVNVVKGIKRSNDIFFYKLAELVGVDRLSTFAKKFGLGEKLGIDLDGEQKGTVPTPQWKKSVIGENWYLGDTYHYGIGQGYLLATPLQVNMWTSVVANNGILYMPHLLKNPKFDPSADGRNPKFLSGKTVDLIRQGMIESCSPGGVAWPLFKLKINPSADGEKLKIDGKNFLETSEATTSAEEKDYREVAIACKTGTAEHGGKETLPHAWITLFAPAYNPQIIVTVLAEESGEGSNIAAPIAKKILEEWFGR